MNGDHPFATWIGNVLGGGTLLATAVGWMPSAITLIASLIALIWYVIQISESETVRRYRAGRRARRIARLKARVILLEAKPPLPPAPTA